MMFERQALLLNSHTPCSLKSTQTRTVNLSFAPERVTWWTYLYQDLKKSETCLDLWQSLKGPQLLNPWPPLSPPLGTNQPTPTHVYQTIPLRENLLGIYDTAFYYIPHTFCQKMDDGKCQRHNNVLIWWRGEKWKEVLETNTIYFHCFLMEIFFSESFCITCTHKNIVLYCIVLYW